MTGMTAEVATLKVNNTDVYAQGDYLFPQAMTETMGIDWEAQRQRIARSSWSEGRTCTVQVRLPGENRTVARFAMHQRIVAMWIAGIDTRHMNPDVKPVVEAWQKEIANVLAEHYYPSKPKEVHKARSAPPKVGATGMTQRQLTALAKSLWGLAPETQYLIARTAMQRPPAEPPMTGLEAQKSQIVLDVTQIAQANVTSWLAPVKQGLAMDLEQHFSAAAVASRQAPAKVSVSLPLPEGSESLAADAYPGFRCKGD